MKKIFWICLLTPLVVIAQEKNYFQQKVDYNITVYLDDLNHVLEAKETIVYTNNSSDDLDFIYFHLWPNAYMDNKTAFAKQQIRLKKDIFYFSHKDNYGWMSDFHFIHAKDTLQFQFYEQNSDVVKVMLPYTLKPGEQIKLKIPFNVQLPYTFSRLGHVENSYQISQWYPKPAVYDKDGWHPMPYLDAGEFYSEFGSFDVSITLPSHYKLAATGQLQSDLERKFNLAHAADTSSLYTYSQSTKTVRFTQDNIHDFAWFADASYKIAHDSVTLHTGKVVQVWYYYTDYWKKSQPKAIQDLKDALYCYSLWVGEYPYSSATAVTGALGAGGGMEYPMVTVTDPYAIIHEVGHNWFYGILATNERDYGWMDEGFNSYIENKVYEFQTERKNKENNLNNNNISSDKIGEADVNLKRREIALSTSQTNLPYSILTSRAFAQPVQLHSNKYYDFNYGISLYSNPPQFLNYLRDYLGTEVFDKCLLEYFDQWKFKHPQPEDLKAVFEQVSGKNLSWFFNDLVKTTNRADAKVKSLKPTDNGYLLTLKNVGKVPFPVQITTLQKDDKIIDTFCVDAIENETTFTIPTTDFYAVQINKNNHNLDLGVNNDYIKKEGLQKLKSLKFQFLTSKDYAKKCETYYMPIVGYNYADGFMPGLAFYNSALVSKKLEYIIAPMFSFRANEIRGLAGINYKWNGNKSLVRNNLVFYGMNYSNWEKLSLDYTHFNASNSFNKIISLQNTYAASRFGATLLGQTLINKASYKVFKNDALHKISAEVNAELFTSMNPSSIASNALRYSTDLKYARKYMYKKWVGLRMFAGSQLEMGTTFDYGLSGKNDYALEYYALDRGGLSSFAGVQTNEGDAGMKQLMLGAATSVLALNFTGDIPKVPLQLFADWATTNGGNSYYDAGISIKVVEDLFAIHFPIVGSGYMNGSPSDFRDFRNNMRFTLKWKIQPIENIPRKLFL